MAAERPENGRLAGVEASSGPEHCSRRDSAHLPTSGRYYRLSAEEDSGEVNAVLQFYA